MKDFSKYNLFVGVRYIIKFLKYGIILVIWILSFEISFENCNYYNNFMFVFILI